MIYCWHPVSTLTLCHVRFFICRRLFYNWIVKINRIIIADGCKLAHTKTNKIVHVFLKKDYTEFIHVYKFLWQYFVYNLRKYLYQKKDYIEFIQLTLAIFCLQFKIQSIDKNQCSFSISLYWYLYFIPKKWWYQYIYTVYQ